MARGNYLENNKPTLPKKHRAVRIEGNILTMPGLLVYVRRTYLEQADELLLLVVFNS